MGRCVAAGDRQPTLPAPTGNNEKDRVQRYSYEATVPQLAELLKRAGASMREVHTSQAECRSQDAAAVTERYGGRSV